MSYTGFLMDEQDPRKREFVGCRMEKELLKQLKEEAARRGCVLSEAIRTICRQGLTNDNAR